MRMPASTDSDPAYVTVAPSSVKPSTGEPSGASALHTSIPALRSRRSPDRHALARKEVEDVVVEVRPAVVRLEDDADGSDVAGVRQHAAAERQSRSRQIEQRPQILGSRHDIAVAAQVEQEDVAGEGVERRRDLAVSFGDD